MAPGAPLRAMRALLVPVLLSMDAAGIVDTGQHYPGCTWPECTPVCDRCHPVPFGTCIVDLPLLKPCSGNGTCSSRLCLCPAGHCRVGDRCMPNSCSGGGSGPEPYEPAPWTRAFTYISPTVPEEGGIQDWCGFALQGLVLPALLIVLGLTTAVGTYFLVTTDEQHSKLPYLPSTPWFVLSLALVTFAVIVFGIVSGHLHMTGVFQLGVEQLDRLHTDLQTASRYANVLHNTSANFAEGFNSIPKSCNPRVPFAQQGMETLTGRGGKYVDKAATQIDKICMAVSKMEEEVSLAQHFSSAFGRLLLLVPILPLLFMFFVTTALIIVTLVSWCHHDATVADRADDVLFEYGGWCIGAVIVSTTLLAAFYLWLGISQGGFCLDLDTNIIGIVDDTNFTALGNLSHNIDPLVDQTFHHYLYGNVTNPVTDAISFVHDLTEGLYGVWSDVDIVLNATQELCPAMRNLDVRGILEQVKVVTKEMHELLHAKNVWPYYSTVMRTMLCGRMIVAIGHLLVINVIVGLIFFPFLSVVAHADLDRLSSWSDRKLQQRSGDVGDLRQARSVGDLRQVWPVQRPYEQLAAWRQDQEMSQLAGLLAHRSGASRTLESRLQPQPAWQGGQLPQPPWHAGQVPQPAWHGGQMLQPAWRDVQPPQPHGTLPFPRPAAMPLQSPGLY